MASTTPIQWADSTVNPTMGCDGCELWCEARRSCYAGRDHERKGGAHPGYARTFREVTRFPGRMRRAAAWASLAGLRRPDKPWLHGMPRLIFVSDMSDALSRAVSFEYLDAEVVQNVESAAGRRHRWLWLTKRPGRLRDFSRWLQRPWPTNLWVGTSLTDSGTLGRVEQLLDVGGTGTTRFLSVEPQVEQLDLAPWLPRLDWVIQGGESGPSARPFELEWARQLRDACVAAGTAYFLKQVGAHGLDKGRPVQLRDRHGGNWEEWPQDLRVRQLPGLTRSP